MESEDTTLPCANKMTFDTSKEAMASVTTAQWRHGGSLKAYRCKYCLLWHIASNYEDGS